MNTQQPDQPDALRLAALYDADAWPGDLSLNAWAAASAAELRRLHAENTTLQAGYDAARLEIDHLRGATKMVAPAQPVAWMVYLPSIDTQNVYDSQDDPGYVDDVTNHADAEVTPLYEMAAPKAEVVPAGEYPPSVAYTELPDFDTVEQRIYAGCRRFISRDMLEPIHGLIREAIDADRAARAPADSVLEDAARWRETLMHIGAANHLGGQHFTLNTLRIADQMFLLRGSVAQHFTKCIDAARAQAKKGA